MNLISHFPKICGHGDQGQRGWGFVCLRVASSILRPLMTPADQGAHVQPSNFPRKVPSLPVRHNQSCLLMPVTQSVQDAWIPADAPRAERNQRETAKHSGMQMAAPLARRFCYVLSAFLGFGFCCVLCSGWSNSH